MSVLSTFFTRSGFPTVITPPRAGIYYTSVAVYDPLTLSFSVQNGVDQTTLSPQAAQLFEVPSSGSAMQLQPLLGNVPYGAFLGPIQAVFYEPEDTAGSFPVTLGALAGLTQWTPAGISIDSSDPVTISPGAPITQIQVSGASAPGSTITIRGLESGLIVGVGTIDASGQVTIVLESGTLDTIFTVTSSAPITATISIFLGVAPVVNTDVTIGERQVLVGQGDATFGGQHVVFNTNPLWRAIWVVAIDPDALGPFSPPIATGSSGVLYNPTTPPYLLPGFPDYQGFWRFIIVPAIETSIDMLLPNTNVGNNAQYWWGADLADVDVAVYDTPGGGPIGSSNSPDPLRFSYAGDLVAGTSDDTDIPGGFISCPPGSTSFLTRLWGVIKGGTSVDVTVTVNSAPSYSGAVPVAGFDPVTITTTPGGFILPTPLQVFDLDLVEIVLSNLIGTPAGLASMVDELIVP